MKRSSTPIPELPAPPRRKRALSEEERALWESVAKQTKPLRKKPRAAKRAIAATAADAPAAGDFAPLRQSRCCVSQIVRARAEAADAAAAGAARTPRAFAIVARQEGNRCQARSAWHDADPRPPRAVGLSATRPQRRPDIRACHHRQGQDRRRIRTRRAAPPGAAMARVCRNSARWWSASRKPISAMAARARFTCGSGGIERCKRHQNGRTIPTRGISVTIQPNIRGLPIIAVDIGGTACEAGRVFDRMQDQEHADRPVRNPSRIVEHDREHDQIASAHHHDCGDDDAAVEFIRRATGSDRQNISTAGRAARSAAQTPARPECWRACAPRYRGSPSKAADTRCN